MGQNYAMGATRRSENVRPIILLPPSEGKADGGTPGTRWKTGSGTFVGLGSARSQVVRALDAARGGSGTLLGVRGTHLERALRANTTLTSSPTLPAWQRYTGVVWDHLDIESLSARARALALTNIVVPSGLAGIVAADDPLPDYRLKMGASLAPLGKLSTWWRDQVSTAFTQHSRGRRVLDMLTTEHRAVFNDRGGWSEITFVSKSGAAIGHDAKATKGLFARHVVTSLAEGATVDDALRSFRGGKFSARVRQL